MAAFNNEIDIANRACQHMGVRSISLTEGFNEDSLQAHEISSCYHQLREAELRRNLWRYSTRRAVIRPIGFNTMILTPLLWSSSTTYFPGAVVSTADGTLWISTAQDNIGNPPGGSGLWDAYFGPLTADPWDSAIAYFAGDLVYRVATNGVVTTYMSLVNSNSDVPGTAQVWSATDSEGDPLYYFKDQVVTYSGATYESLVDLNGGNTPGLAPAAWAIGTTYALGAQIVGSDAVVYTSAVAGNLGHNPVSSPSFWNASGLSNPAAWAIATTYGAGTQVVASDGIIYASIAAGNTGNNPANGAAPTLWTNTGATAPWTTTITNGTGSLNWAQLSAALVKLLLAYPIGSGPVEETNTRNVYHLPAGFLREAPQNPKAGSTNFLGGPSGNAYNDWDKEGDYLVTGDSEPIVYRFGANIRSVRAMDPMFCEGLAARIGSECVERVTQSNAKKATIDLDYKKVMGDARAVNGIETGPTEPPEDEFITVRQ